MEQVILLWNIVKEDEHMELVGVFSEDKSNECIVSYLDTQKECVPLLTLEKLYDKKSVKLNNGNELIMEYVPLNKELSYAV